MRPRTFAAWASVLLRSARVSRPRPEADRRSPRSRSSSFTTFAAWASILLTVVSGCGTRTVRETAPVAATAPARPFEKLSQYALFAGEPAAQRPAEGVIPYDLNSPLFSDYAEKFRFVKLPAGMHATYRDVDAFEFPIGTVIAKTFAYPRDARDPSKGRRLIETRILEREPDGWVGRPYIWNAAQTEATLDVAGDTVDVSWIHTDGRTRTNNYIIPNSNQCKGCHKAGEMMVPIGPKGAPSQPRLRLSRRDGEPARPLEPAGCPVRFAGSERSAPAGRLGRPEKRHIGRPCPSVAGDQLRSLPQSRRPGAQLRARPASFPAQPDQLRRLQGASSRWTWLRRSGVRPRPRSARPIHRRLPDRLDPPGRHDARVGQAAGA